MARYKDRLDPNDVGLPPRPFLYTIDQIATLLSISQELLRKEYLFFEGRSVGAHPKDQMLARNIAPPERDPDWRVIERELIRWMKRRGFVIYEHGWGRL